MTSVYFNHTPVIATNRRERRRFVSHWWRIYAGDPRWVPPHFPTLCRELDPSHNQHTARMAPVVVYVEALARSQTPSRHGSQGYQLIHIASQFEVPVAAAVALLDPRRRDGVAHLALLRCVNDPASMRRLLDHVAEALRARGCRRLVGPTGLSPYLGTGLLQDHWDRLPPLHSPYDPPYMPELVGSRMRVLGRARLYHLDIPQVPSPAPPGPAQLSPLKPSRLANDLLPLLVAACPSWAGFAPPDEEEAAFLLRWLGVWPLFGWLAQIRGEAVGFVLLQPDLSCFVRRASGGRRRLWRLWLARASQRSTRRGRLLALGVLPQWRGQGVGCQLLHRAQVTASGQRWQTLSVGPLPATTPARAFLQRQGGHSRQSYFLYQWDF